MRSGGAEPLFANYHGELLINCIDGLCIVWTPKDHVELASGDTVLLVDREPFRIDRVEGQEVDVAPGSNRTPAEGLRQHDGHATSVGDLRSCVVATPWPAFGNAFGVSRRGFHQVTAPGSLRVPGPGPRMAP